MHISLQFSQAKVLFRSLVQYFYAASYCVVVKTNYYYSGQQKLLQKARNMANISNILEDVRATNNGHENGSEVDSNYILIDIGANLTNKKFSRDVDAVVQRAKESGVQKIMVKKFCILNEVYYVSERN